MCGESFRFDHFIAAEKGRRQNSRCSYSLGLASMVFLYSGKNWAQIGRCLAQGSSCGAVINNWILLDSCSTFICSKNDSIISKVTVIPLEEHLCVYSNGCHTYYTMRGILDILPMDIYVNDNSMATIFYLK